MSPRERDHDRHQMVQATDKIQVVDDKAVGELERVLNGARRDSSDDLAAFLSKPETEQLAGTEDLAKMLGQ